MKIHGFVKNYFNGFNEAAKFKNNTSTVNFLAASKILSYFTAIIPLTVIAIYGAASLLGRVKKNIQSSDQKNTSELVRKTLKQNHFNASKVESLTIGGLSNVHNSCYFGAALQSMLHVPICIKHLGSDFNFYKKKGETEASFELRNNIKPLLVEVLSITRQGKVVSTGKMEKLIKLLHTYNEIRFPIPGPGDPIGAFEILLDLLQISDDLPTDPFLHYIGAGGNNSCTLYHSHNFEESDHEINLGAHFQALEAAIQEAVDEADEGFKARIEQKELEKCKVFRPEIVCVQRETNAPCRYSPSSTLEVVLSKDEDPYLYSLSSVIYNTGGHMIAYLWDPSDEKRPWIKLDDTKTQRYARIDKPEGIYGIIYSKSPLR